MVYDPIPSNTFISLSPSNCTSAFFTDFMKIKEMSKHAVRMLHTLHLWISEKQLRHKSTSQMTPFPRGYRQQKESVMTELRILATFFFGKTCSWLGGDKNESLES